MFARVITTEIAIDRLDEAVRIAHERLPAAREYHGYQGFYVLADRIGGRMITISLWDSRDDVQVVEARAAGIRDIALRSVTGTPPAVSVYEVEIADQA